MRVRRGELPDEEADGLLDLGESCGGAEGAGEQRFRIVGAAGGAPREDRVDELLLQVLRMAEDAGIARGQERRGPDQPARTRPDEVRRRSGHEEVVEDRLPELRLARLPAR